MNRRAFSKKILLLGAGLVVLPLSGCPAQSTLAELTEALGEASANVARLEGNPSLGLKLHLDTEATIASIDGWHGGDVTSEVIEALNIVADDLSLFPIANQYAPLVNLAIGTVEAILVALPKSPGTIVPLRRSRAMLLPRRTPKTASQFKTEWNAYVKAHPETQAALIQQ